MEEQTNKAALENKLNELLKEVGGTAELPNQRLANLTKNVQDNSRKLQESLDSLTELMDNLRICVKYQLFDLEATRRENQYLRHLLDKRDEE